MINHRSLFPGSHLLSLRLTQRLSEMSDGQGVPVRGPGLPTQVWTHGISGYLSAQLLVRLGATCRALHDVIVAADRLWQPLYVRDWESDSVADPFISGLPQAQRPTAHARTGAASNVCAP